MPCELRYSVKLINSETIVTTSTSTSNGYDLSGSKAKLLAIWVQVESGSSPDIKLTYEMADKDVSAHYVTPTGESPLINALTDTNPRVIDIESPPMKWIRLKVTGNPANGSNTVVTVKLTLTSY